MPDNDQAKRVCLFGTPRILVPAARATTAEPKPLPADPAVLEMLALLVLAREFLPSDSDAKEDGEVRRDFLAATLFPADWAQKAQTAREKVRYALGKLHAVLPVRPTRQAGERERGVARAQWTQVDVDVLRLRGAARSLHSPTVQEEVVALAERPLLDGMSYGWLQTPAFQTVRAELDAVYLSALARRADSLLLSMERAREAGQADTLRADILPLLDRAAECLHQFPHPLLAEFDARFAALRRRASYSLPNAVAPSRLPQPTTAFFGRAPQLADIRARLDTGRLVTLTGMGGGGKTRLALHAAAALEASGEDVRWVELASLADPALLPATVAAALGVAVQGGVSVMDALVAFLQKPLLLVLDNCEHLLNGDADGDDGATFTAGLLRSCAGLRVLATSRRPLNIGGESVCPVPPLPVPPLRFAPGTDAVDALLHFDGARLFADRAGHFGPFTVQAEHVPSIAAICAALDGIPLAIELAAARVKTLPVDRIAEMLSDRFGLLTDGRRDSPARHKTLRAVIDWSYDLLSEAEQELLCRLSVFAGGWTLDAAEAIGAGGDVLDLVTGLVDKSLVTFDAARFRMLETVRQYAQDRLRERGAWDETCRRHRDYFLALAEQAEPQLRGPEQKQWLDRLEAEHDNLRVALAWRTDETAMRLACALSRFWWVRGHLEEGRDTMRRLLAQQNNTSLLGAHAFLVAGRLAYRQGADAQADALYAQGLAIYTHLQDASGTADALFCLSNVAERQGELSQAEEYLGQSLALFQKLGSERGISDALYGLGMVAQNQDRYAASHKFQQQSLTLRRALGDTVGIANSLASLGRVAFYQGRYADAEQHFAECLACRQTLDETQGIASSLNDLAEVAKARGDYAQARALLHQSLQLHRDRQYQRGAAEVLIVLGEVAYCEEQFAEAEDLYRQCLALLETHGTKLDIAMIWNNLGGVARQQSRFSEARALLRQSLAFFLQHGEKLCLANSLEEFAFLAAAQGAAQRAAILWGAGQTLSAHIGFCRPANQNDYYNQAVQEARATLGEQAFAEAWATGQAMTWEQATAFAMETTVQEEDAAAA